MRNFIGIQQVHHFQAAVFQIPTAKGLVFMYEDRSNYMNDERAVVEVDADKFLRLWRMPSSSHPEVAGGNPSTWPDDYKFHWSDKHFAEGFKNPVPLARVSCRIEPKKPSFWRSLSLKSRTSPCDSETASVHFTDGVTRTIWLLAAGARSFPVECPTADAPLLHRLAGVRGTRWRTVDDLVP